MIYKKSTVEVDGIQQWKKTDSGFWFHLSINQPCGFEHLMSVTQWQDLRGREKPLCFVLKKQRNLMLRNREKKKKNLCFIRTSPTIFHVNCWLCFRFLTKTQITPKLNPRPKFITYSGKIFDEQYCTTSISILTVLPQLSLLASGLIGSS